MPEGAAAALILVEREEQVPSALALLKSQPSPPRLLALSPAVMRAFEEAGVPFSIPEEFLPPDALTDRGAENYSRLEQLGDAVEALLPALPEALRINPVRLHFYRLKILFDSFGLRVQELCAVLEGVAPSELVVFRSEDDPLWAAPDDLQFMKTDGPVYAAAAELAAGACSVPVRTVTVPGSPQAAAGGPLAPLRRAASSLKRFLRLAVGCAAARRGLPLLWQVGDVAHDVSDLLKSLSGRFRVLQLENALHRPLGGLLSRALGPSFDSAEQDAAGTLWAGAERLLEGHPCLEFSGVDCFPLVRTVLSRLFTEEHLEACRLHAALRRLVRASRPRAALMVNTPFTANVLASWALSAEGVPVVYAQEGGLYGYCETPMHHYCELSWGDFFLSYGKACSERLNSVRPTPRQKARAVTVGAFRLRNLSASSRTVPPPPPDTIVYAASAFHHNVRYAPLCYGEREYYLLRKMVLEALLESRFKKIVYKAVPRSLAGDPLLPFIEAHSERIEASEAPLTEALGAGGHLVVDWPTTTLLEVLCTRRPVHVLLDSRVARPLAGAMPLLRRRASVHFDPASLAASLRSAPAQGQRSDDDSFLEAYGTAGDSAWDSAQVAGFFASLEPVERNP